mgnify:CR=1 FL=1
MSRYAGWVLIAVLGLVVGVGLSSLRAFPTEDMVARATCAECHDVHGAIEFAEAPVQSQVWILGDVPEATYFMVADLFPYATEERDTSITLDDLLARYGVTEWERVAIESLDGGLVVLAREYVTEHSLLVPYVEGIRFMDRNQHESTWLKGVRWIVVEGAETPLAIAGEATSLGRLLLADRTTVVAEGAEAMYRSELDGALYRGLYAHVYTGARVREALGEAWEAEAFRAVDARGRETEFPREDLARAVIATVNGRPSLVLPDEGRARWVIDLVSLDPSAPLEAAAASTD